MDACIHDKRCRSFLPDIKYKQYKCCVTETTVTALGVGNCVF